MSVTTDIEQKLRDALNPAALEVSDDSQQHAGHMGARPGGETHFTVKITAQAFEGLNRVAQQRLIYKILAEEMAGPVHALAIEAKAG